MHAADEVDERVAPREHLGQLVHAARVEHRNLGAERPQRLRGRWTPNRRPDLVAGE
jgi:hypothetical protein